MIPLCNGLFIAGFTEKDETVVNTPVQDMPNDELEEYEIQTSSSISIIHEMLTSISSSIESAEHKSSTLPSTIFLLNYKYPHTLNHFLFHSTRLLKEAAVSFCIIPRTRDDDLNLPSELGQLNIIAPLRMKLGYYTVIELTSQEQLDDQYQWILTSKNNYQLGVSDYF